jgi:hypothetical protein
MKIKQTIAQFCLVATLFVGITAFVAPVAYAVDCSKSNNAQECCGGAETSIIRCSQGAGTTTESNGVWALLMIALNILTAGIGIAAVGGIAYGAALYASSSDKPEQAKAGITFIKNVVIGLVAYGLMFVLLNFLIPGGIFN